MFSVVPADKTLVPSLLLQGRCLPSQEHPRVGLAVQHPDKSSNKAGTNQEDPVHPSPADTLRDEATTDRANDRAKEWAHCIDGCCLSTLLGGEEITDNTTSDCKTTGTTNATEEAEDDEGVEIGSEGTANLPDNEESIGVVKDGTTTIDLTKG